jgi:hypothetical protein
VRFAKNNRFVTVDEFGMFDNVDTDRQVKITGRLWSGWEDGNLPKIFPSYFLGPTVGTRIYGSTDLPLVINGNNGTILTVHNVQITKIPSLFLGVNQELFSADVEFTGLIVKNALPSDAAAYYTKTTGAYSAPTLDRSKFAAPVISADWGAVAGFTPAFATVKGWNLEFTPELSNEVTVVDGLGTLDYTVKDFYATAKAIPVGPTEDQLLDALNMQNGIDLGERLSGTPYIGDLTLTVGATAMVTLKNTILLADGTGLDFSREKFRFSEVTWRTLPDQTNPAAARVVVTALP